MHLTREARLRAMCAPALIPITPSYYRTRASEVRDFMWDDDLPVRRPCDNMPLLDFAMWHLYRGEIIH